MTYLSLEFFLVFFLFFALYWAFSCSPALQNTLLLLASYAMVFSFGTFSLLVIFIYSVLTFFLSHYLFLYPKEKIGTAFIVILVISLLFPFKYYDFFIQTIEYSFYSFVPKTKFKGKTECFDIKILPELIEDFTESVLHNRNIM